MVFLALDRVIWGPAKNQLVDEGVLGLIYIEIVLHNKLRPAKNRQASYHSQTEKWP